MRRAVWAVVVARLGPTAKSRLAPTLGPEERALLAQAMLADVLDVVWSVELPIMAVVAGGAEPPDARRAAVVPDPGRGMNAAVAAGVEAARVAGAKRVLVLPGDVPLATAEELRALVRAADQAPRVVAVARDRHGTGTNGLLLGPPDVIAPAFGTHSALRHVEAARATGAVGICVDLPGLALDVDTPEDLPLLAARGPAGRVAQALVRLGSAPRYSSRPVGTGWRPQQANAGPTSAPC